MFKLGFMTVLVTIVVTVGKCIETIHPCSAVRRMLLGLPAIISVSLSDVSPNTEDRLRRVTVAVLSSNSPGFLKILQSFSLDVGCSFTHF